MANSPRRFIAGAICSQCKSMDTTVLYRDEDQKQHIECVQCGFTQSQDDLAQPVKPTTGITAPITWNKRGKQNTDQGN